MATWWATRVECVSALNRLCRTGGIGEKDLKEALSGLTEFADGWIDVVPYSGDPRVVAGGTPDGRDLAREYPPLTVQARMHTVARHNFTKGLRTGKPFARQESIRGPAPVRRAVLAPP